MGGAWEPEISRQRNNECHKAHNDSNQDNEMATFYNL